MATEEHTPLSVALGRACPTCSAHTLGSSSKRRCSLSMYPQLVLMCCLSLHTCELRLLIQLLAHCLAACISLSSAVAMYIGMLTPSLSVHGRFGSTCHQGRKDIWLVGKTPQRCWYLFVSLAHSLPTYHVGVSMHMLMLVHAHSNLLRAVAA